jgi:F0F1-type ATP synthase epsilon subunit
MSIQLTVATLTSNKQYTISWLECETENGTLMILSGHAPLACSLKKQSQIRFALLSGGIETITLNQALLQVDRHTVTIIGA